MQEAIRKKTLHVLIGLGILIMILLPVILTADDPEAKVKMVLATFFQVVVLLCIVGVILLSAASLPHEIEDRSIYGILSKPVSRLKVIAGKIVGFALLSAFLLAALSLLNIAIIHRIVSKLPEEYKGILKARKEFQPSQFSIQGKVHHIREGFAWIEGGRSGVASWNFSNVCKKSEDSFAYEAEFNLKTESIREFADTIPLVVRIEDSISCRGNTEVLSLNVDKPLTIKIDQERVREDSVITITAFPLHSTDYIGITQTGVKVFSLQKGFVSNYAKAIIITFLKFLLIITIAVMGSTYLSVLVSMISALVVFLCGHILEFIKDFTLLAQHHDVHEHALPSVLKKPNILLIYLDYFIKKPLEWISFILPDFKRFDILKFLLKGINIPLETVGICLGYTVIYAGICLLISTIIFKKREFL